VFVALWSPTIEIVDLPNYKMVMFHSYVYQRAGFFWPNGGNFHLMTCHKVREGAVDGVITCYSQHHFNRST
jgi:hypothetical protein